MLVNEKLLEELVREVIRQMESGEASPPAASPSGCENREACGSLEPAQDYPLAQKHPEMVKTIRGKSLADITLNGVISGEVKPEDVRITADTLQLQAQIAEACGRKQFAQNLRRASELVNIPDDRILEIYNALRPYRSTKEELMRIAHELEHKYGAHLNAAFIREAAGVYERRKRLRAG
ncbi:propanediol dehydratase [Clostridiales bacterium PH28_bin88]|nr:propanediol dehydratase [Clostridiales bacterium PH28_bin88]